MTDPDRTAAVVLAAGAGSRFGGGKLLAQLGGRSLLEHVLDAIRDAGLAETIVVVAPDSTDVEAIAVAHGARIVVNPRPGDGLSSSVRVGLAALTGAGEGHVDAALIALGDQPRTSPATIRTLLDAQVPAGRSLVVPRYRGGGGPNPALLLRAAWPLAVGLQGDRGFGPLMKAHPELVLQVDQPGDNPDVDTPADLAGIAEAAWSERVLANQAQVERIREVPDGVDFYAPVRSLFRADPTRTDDPVLGELLKLTRPGDRWLDVGAGAGRFALPIARALESSGGEVVALDASPSMLEALADMAEEHGIRNVRPVEARWPPEDSTSGASAGPFSADAALIAHVAYDVAAIGPFLDALEAAARRLCVAVLMEHVPASAADPFWPAVHGEAREKLPALPEFVDLLRSRGRTPQVERVWSEARRFESREAVAGFVRRQLWIDPDGPKELRFQAALDALALQEDGGWAIRGRPANDIGVVTWRP